MVREIGDDEAKDDDDLDDLDDQEMDPLCEDENYFEERDALEEPDDGYNGQLMAPADTLTPQQLDEVQAKIKERIDLVRMYQGEPDTYIFNRNLNKDEFRQIPSGSEVLIENKRTTVEVFNLKSPKDQRKIEKSKLHGRFKGIFGYYDSGTA